jgi:hypothetical protein
MKIIVQIKFESEKPRLVRFGDFKYLVYLSCKKEDPSAMQTLIKMLASELTVPPNGFRYKGKQGEMHIFEID